MNEKKIIIGLVGRIGAGKTAATDFLKDKYDAKTFRFSDMLRDVLTRLHIDLVRENLQLISTVLRQNFGEDLMSKVIALDVQNSDASFIITEGIRRPSDIEYLKKIPGFYLVGIMTDQKNRYERIIKRPEKPDEASKTWEQFKVDDEREAEQKIDDCLKMADTIIDNNGTIEGLYEQLNSLVKNLALKN